MTGQNHLWAKLLGGQNHGWAKSLVGKITGGQNHWWAKSLVGKIIGGQNHWWAKSLVGKIIGGQDLSHLEGSAGVLTKQPVEAGAIEARSVGQPLHRNTEPRALSRRLQLW
jgi:hypothetical protein